MVYNKCKNLAPITAKRKKNYPQLDGKSFCLYKLKTAQGDFEKNYSLVLCGYFPQLIGECKKLFREEIKVLSFNFLRHSRQ